MISHGNLTYSILQAITVSDEIAKVYTVSSLCLTTFVEFMNDSQAPPLDTPEGIPVSLAFLPLHHSYGLHAYALRAFLQPSTFVLLKQWDIEIALQAIPK
jgi:hypothetical protein